MLWKKVATKAALKIFFLDNLSNPKDNYNVLKVFFFFLVYIMSLSLGYGNWFSLIMNGHVLRSFCIPVTTVVRPCSLPLARDPNLKLMSLKRT
jgi:hypothetical protein